jgi:hypothetical protein
VGGHLKLEFPDEAVNAAGFEVGLDVRARHAELTEAQDTACRGSGRAGMGQHGSGSCPSSPATAACRNANLVDLFPLARRDANLVELCPLTRPCQIWRRGRGGGANDDGLHHYTNRTVHFRHRALRWMQQPDLVREGQRGWIW